MVYKCTTNKLHHDSEKKIVVDQMLCPNSTKSKEVATDENFLFGKQNLQKVRKNYKLVRKQNSKAEFRRK